MANNPTRGWQVILGVGLESTPGTPVTPTEWYEIQSEGIRPEPDIQDFTGLSGVRGTSRTSRVCGNVPVGGDLNVHARQNIIGNWLYWAMGGGNGAAPTLANTALPSLTVAVDRIVKKFIANGCKVGTLELSSETNGPLTIHPTLVGMGYSDGAGGVTTPSYDDQVTYPILMHHGLTLTVGGNAIELHRFNATIENNLNMDHFVNSQYRTVVPEGRREINLTLGLDWDTLTMVTRAIWTNFLAGTTAQLVARYSDGVHYVSFTFPYVRYTGAPLGTEGVGDIVFDVTAAVDDSGPGVTDSMTVAGL